VCVCVCLQGSATTTGKASQISTVDSTFFNFCDILMNPLSALIKCN